MNSRNLKFNIGYFFNQFSRVFACVKHKYRWPNQFPWLAATCSLGCNLENRPSRPKLFAINNINQATAIPKHLNQSCRQNLLTVIFLQIDKSFCRQCHAKSIPNRLLVAVYCVAYFESNSLIDVRPIQCAILK